MTLKTRIMRRIYILYVLRRATSRRAVALYAFLAAAVGTFTLVSVSNVLANMPSLINVSEFVNFALVAVLNTTILVQMLIAVALVALVAFVRDVIATRTGSWETA